MLCYGDKTYCTSPYCKNVCGRQVTEEIKKLAYLADLPLACANFCEPSDEEKALADYIDSYP